MSSAFDKVTFRGRLMDRKTQAFLAAMEERLGYPLTVVQGSYNAGGVAASAGTHDGGGVVDLVSWDARNKVRVARELGAFAWLRAELPGVWGEHIHLGIRDHGRLASQAQDQQRAYDADPPRDGLAGNRVDDSWHPDPAVTFAYPPEVLSKAPEENRVTRARDAITQAVHDLGEAAALLAETDEERTVAQGQVDDLRELRRGAREVLERLPKR